MHRLADLPAFQALESRIHLSAAPDLLARELFDFGGGNDQAYAVHVLPDGRTLVAGRADLGGGADMAVLCYGPTGILDPAFGDNGRATVDLGSAYDAAMSLAVQPDGGIVLAGQTYTDIGGYDFAIARLNPDGSLDAGFGDAGVVRGNLFGSFEQASAVALEPDGDIVVAGIAIRGIYTEVAVARYLPDGSPDGAFGLDGRVVAGVDGVDLGAGAVVIDGDGRIVVAGQGMSWETFQQDLAIVRLTPEGLPDAGFAPAGVLMLDAGGDDDALHDAVALPGGGLLLAGESADQMLALRLAADGQVDAAFGGGLVRVLIGNGAVARAAIVREDGSVLLAGTAWADGDGDFAVVALGADGTIDEEFGVAGVLRLDLGSTEDQAMAAAAGAGQLVVAGVTGTPSGDYDFATVFFGSAPARNTAPQASIIAPAAALRGRAVRFEASIVDPDAGDSHVVTWDFGDGTTGTGAVVDHAFPAGRFSVNVTVRDAARDEGESVQEIEVKPVMLVPDPEKPGRTALMIAGTSGKDLIVVTPLCRGKVAVFLNGRFAGKFNPTGRIIIEGGDGNDVLMAAGVGVPVALFGGAGDDKLIGGRCADLLSGGDGSDIFIGGGGKDAIVADAADPRRGWMKCR